MSEHVRTTYSQAFKEESVRQYLETDKSYRKICEERGIKDKKTLRCWVNKVKNGETLAEMRGKSSGLCKRRPKTNFASVEEELEYVKAERDYLKILYKEKFGHDWEDHKKKFGSK